MTEMVARDEKFWSKVSIGEDDKCWMWTGYTVPPAPSRLPYGMYHTRDGSKRAHRYAYEQAFGPIPPGLCVCHKCDNPPCCNPAHLWVGTQGENNRDRARKGRTAKPDHKAHPRQYAVGAKHGRSKLTSDQAIAIYNDRRGYRKLAQVYGVDRRAIFDIKRGISWRHATGASNE